MGKFALLFLIAGLGLGLWLGFYPPARRATQNAWDTMMVRRTEAKPGIEVTMRHWNSRLGGWLRTSPREEPSPASRSTAAPLWHRITTAAEAFWQALQRIWANMLARMSAMRG